MAWHFSTGYSVLDPIMARPLTNRDSGPNLGYLISQYPAVSHTFIMRELQQLRQLGLVVATASVKRGAPSPKGFTDAELSEAASTFYVMSGGAIRFVREHASCFISSPRAYLRGLSSALRIAGFDISAILHHLLYFGQAISIGEWMRHQRLSHLHVHFANAAATAALLVKNIYGFSYSMTVHGPDEFYDVGFYHLREKIDGASFICCISNFCRSQLMKSSSPDNWAKMEVCALGVDPDVFRPHHATAENREFQIVCVGRLTPAKGQAILLLAAARLLERGRRFHLHMVGDGPDRSSLERQTSRLGLEQMVTFHGAVNQTQVAELLSRANVFTLPSFAEGVPVSLMEAMAMEIPCVSTKIAGIPELIDSGKDGILVPPSDPNLLADALESLIDNPEMRARIARAGRVKVIEDYNLPVNVGKLAEIFSTRLSMPLLRAPEAPASAN